MNEKIKSFTGFLNESYILDDFPDLKKEVIDGAGIQDFSKLGKVIGKGWIR